VKYIVEGSNGLADFDREVMEIPARSEGMPAPDSGWSYRSFRLDGAISGSTPSGFSPRPDRIVLRTLHARLRRAPRSSRIVMQ
jgi:hypothetical protein